MRTRRAIKKPARARGKAAAAKAIGPAVRASPPERAFAGRVRPPAPDPPLPVRRRAIFVDVENSSRAEHLGRVLDHLAIDRRDRRLELVAVGNWRVIGADSARLLARRGAHLVHSAPATGVRDWSDLRIAVSAGVWLASARPGDLIEIVSDDRAFDAVGDVAALLGVEYRRLSSRGLMGLPAAEEAAAPAAPAPRQRRGRRRRRGRRERAVPLSLPPARPHADTVAHTAPHDELVEIVRELVQHAPTGAVLIDTLARLLKERGFSRPPGSPRLITRLRRIRELAVSKTGMITLAGTSAADDGRPSTAAPGVEMSPVTSPRDDVSAPDGAPRRSRRGRRRRRHGGGRPAPPPPA